MDIWHMIANQRRQLADLLDSFDETLWHTPSLCDGWTVREVAGHLVTPFELGTLAFLLRLVANRFSVNATMMKTAKELAQRPTSALVRILRANSETRWTPPGLGPEAPLTDIVMHTLDICRPLGIQRSIDGERLRRILDYLVSGKVRIVTPRSRIAGLRLLADDLDWSWGYGPEVQGTAAAVMMAIGGRTALLADLTGSGLDLLRTRLLLR